MGLRAEEKKLLLPVPTLPLCKPEAISNLSFQMLHSHAISNHTFHQQHLTRLSYYCKLFLQAALGRTLLEEFHDGSPSKWLSGTCSPSGRRNLISNGTCQRNGVSFSSASINYKDDRQLCRVSRKCSNCSVSPSSQLHKMFPDLQEGSEQARTYIEFSDAFATKLLSDAKC